MRPTGHRVVRAAIVVALVLLPAASRADEADRSAERAITLDPMVVTGSSPIPGLGQPIDRVPANVQQLNAGDVESLAPLATTDVLGRRAGSVYLGQTQNNPYQPDVLYRGFTSSFLLGSPQGLSVFQDGVRLNDFLGDAMNWDLVAEDSLETIEIVPGANPVYGRNTLGGAIVLQTKSGRTAPGTSAELSYGSFGRFHASASQAGTLGPDEAFDYLAMGDFGGEDGFRDFSRSRVAHAFLRAGWRAPDATEIWVTYDLARNRLRGNGTVPESLLDQDRSAVFTQPDVAESHLDFVTVHASHPFEHGLRIDASGYYRRLAIHQFNADAADDEGGDASSSDDDRLPGVDNRTSIDQERFGGTIQGSHAIEHAAADNLLTVGVDGEGGDAGVRLDRQPGRVNDRRGVDPTGAREPATDVDSTGHSVGTYVTDTLTPLSWVSFTGSLRYDHTQVAIDNRLEPESGGAHSFGRVNPAAGVNVRLGERLDLYGNYGESFRAPSAIELSCASENDPCPLPVAFADDPPLRKVVAKSYEVGLHARPAEGTRAALAFFLTNLHDDILFVASSRSQGFFQNVDETRRMGLEASADGRVRGVSWFLSYSLTRATFESTASFPSAAGENVARPGDEIPGVPRHLFKGGLDAGLPFGFHGGVDLQFVGRQFLRGDESNQRRPLGAHAVVNARLSYRWRMLTLFARAENLFDADYETAGVFGQNPFAGGRVERFLSPGAPLGGWFGVRVDL